MHQRGGAEADQEPRRDADRQRGPERDPGDRADADQPSADLPQRPRQVRRRRHDHRGRECDAHRQVDRRRLGVEDARQARGHLGAAGVAGEDREARREPHGDHLVQEQPLPSACEQDHDQQHQGPDDQQVVGDLPEPPREVGELGHEVRGGGVDRRGSRCVKGQDQGAEDREHQQDGIRGSPRPRGVRCRGEDPDADGLLASAARASSAPPLPSMALPLCRRGTSGWCLRHRSFVFTRSAGVAHPESREGGGSAAATRVFGDALLVCHVSRASSARLAGHGRRRH